MKQNSIPLQIAYLFLFSVIFFFIYYFLYSILKSPSISVISIVIVSLIAWRRGLVSGLIIALFNCTWILLTLQIKADQISISPVPDAVIGIFIHFVFALISGYVGNLGRRLQLEIEERKKVEVLLSRHRDELELRVEERTRELEEANLRLHQSEKMETIGQLAGGIAHDFKNHLTIILGFSNLLIKRLDPHSQEADFVRQILSSSERASELTLNLMNFARKERYKLQPLDINSLITQTVSFLSRSLSSVMSNKIDISFSPTSNLPLIMGGKSQIQNALLNLVLNARDAMEYGGTISITTSLINVTQEYCKEHNLSCVPGTYVSLSLTDTGCGILPEHLPHLFEPFFTTKAEGKGTGMGLVTIRGITHQHAGDIFVESEPGKRTEFTMLFPVTQKSK